MCIRCSNIKAQTVLRSMYKSILGRSPTLEEMREFSKNLPKAKRAMQVSPQTEKLLAIEHENLRAMRVERIFMDLSHEQKLALMERLQEDIEE